MGVEKSDARESGSHPLLSPCLFSLDGSSKRTWCIIKSCVTQGNFTEILQICLCDSPFVSFLKEGRECGKLVESIG